MKFSLSPIRLDLIVNWKLSRNESAHKVNFIFKIIEGDYEFCSEIAPNIRYGETQEKIEKDFEYFIQAYNSSADLNELLYGHDFCHSFQFAVESAFTHKKAFDNNQSVWDYLGLKKENDLFTSFSVPIMDEYNLVQYLKKLKHFKFIKIKVNQDNASDFVSFIAKNTSAALRIDANEGWSDLDSYKRFEKEVVKYNIQFIEQPFSASMVDDYIALKKDSEFEIMADESIEQNIDWDLLQKQFHSVNIKLMKAGGYQKAISLAQNAKKRGMKTMIGCMIETGLGISCAMNIASLFDYFDLDGSLLIKNDPFSLVEQRDGMLNLV